MDSTNTGQAQAADSVSGRDEFTHENYPEHTPGQLDQLRKGKLPGETKIQAVTLVLSLVAIVLSTAAIVMQLM